MAGEATDPIYRAVFRSAVDFAIIATDRDARIVEWNSGAEHVFGWTATEAIGRDIGFLFTEQDRAQGRPAFEMRQALTDGRASDERWHLHRNGRQFWASGEMMPLRDTNGSHIGFLKILRDRTAQRAADTTLRETRGLNSLIMRALPDCIVVLDLAAHTLFVSEGGIESMEIHNVDAIIGLSWLRVWQGDDHAAAQAAVNEARAGGIGRFQGFCATHRGTPKWWDVVISPLPGLDGTPERLVAVGRDITAIRAQQRRQAALLDLGDRLRGLSDIDAISHHAAAILAATLGANRAGYGTVDPEAETVEIRADYHDPAIPSVAGLLRFRDFGTYIDELKRGAISIVNDAAHDDRTSGPNHRLRDINVNALVNLPIFEHGRFVAVYFVCRPTAYQWTDDDIIFIREVADRTRASTERLRAEAALRALNATLELQVEERTRERDRAWKNSQDMQTVLDSTGRLRAVNDAWTTILGYRPDELIGHDFREFIHPDDQPSSKGALSTASSSNLPPYENRYRHKDGTWRWISWVAAPEGGLIYASGRHITIEKQQAEALELSEAQLRQSQKMQAIGQLTGGIAHDFNNLLTGISGNLELLQRRLAQGRTDTLETYVTSAQGGAARAAALTHRLLAFSRRQTLDPKPTDINQLTTGMEELIRRTVGPAITLDFVLADDIWPTLCDPNQLENALLNLCINARDAMPDGGRLTVESCNRRLDARAARACELPEGHYVSLCVSDSGTGMTADVIARAFDPFFTTKPIGLGTGLGLSMTYGFARQSGGQVRIYSEPAQGTMVCIYLPRHDRPGHGSEMESATPPADQAPVPNGAGEIVLVVDDEPTVRALVTEALAELGYAALEAVDGAAGLAILQSPTRVDLLITDVGLPGGMNGRQMADAARTLRPDLKVLFITGYAEAAMVGHGHLDAGMHMLTKPFSLETLAARVSRLIGDG